MEFSRSQQFQTLNTLIEFYQFTSNGTSLLGFAVHQADVHQKLKTCGLTGYKCPISAIKGNPKRFIKNDLSKRGLYMYSTYYLEVWVKFSYSLQLPVLSKYLNSELVNEDKQALQNHESIDGAQRTQQSKLTKCRKLTHLPPPSPPKK